MGPVLDEIRFIWWLSLYVVAIILPGVFHAGGVQVRGGQGCPLLRDGKLSVKNGHGGLAANLNS